MKLWSDVQTWVGTPHRIQRQRGDTAQKDRTDGKDRGGDTAQVLRVGGRVGGRVVYQSNNATLWLHLASWNLQLARFSA